MRLAYWDWKTGRSAYAEWEARMDGFRKELKEIEKRGCVRGRVKRMKRRVGITMMMNENDRGKGDQKGTLI